MQRFGDLLGIGKGTVKVGQAFVQGPLNHVQHWTNTSSIAKPAMEMISQVCGSCQSFQHIDFENISYTKTDYDMSAPESDEPKIDLNKSNASYSSNESVGVASSKEFPDNATSKGHFSSISFIKQCLFLSSNAKELFYCDSNPKHFHTSCFCSALTSEELAKLAKLKQLRKSKDKSKPVNETQTLNPESRERKVPSSRIGRLSSFGGLAAGLAIGSLSDYAKKSIGYVQDGASGTASLNASLLFSEANLNRIVSTLCTVRGAALKLGQMLSIQDSSVVDPKLLEVFDRVRQSADFMPASQMKKVLVKEFGPDWRSLLKEFDEKPFAAASIGQVHRAVLHDGTEVAMKIQYPGVAESIDSDVNNLVTLLKFWNVFPEQLFIDKFIDVARVELALECDYEREGEFSENFRKQLQDEEIYGVPRLIPELSSKKVLTSELVSGLPIDKVSALEQDDRNFVAAAVLRLVLRELFEFRCMQTDPNWANFLYDSHQQKLWLLDFGAARHYSKEFIDQYIEIVKGAAVGDRTSVLDISRSMGFLTGYESKVMEEAHVDAIMILGEPFSTEEVFDFSKQSTSHRIVKLVPTFLKHRLTPPPEETYSLHRKLSGAFLIATKLQAQFACKQMFDDIYESYWIQSDGKS